MPRCAAPISEARTDAARRRPAYLLRPRSHPAGRRSRSAGGPDRGCSRPQRRRQDHHAALDSRACSAATRPGPARRPGCGGLGPAPHRAGGRRLCSGRPDDLSRLDGGGKHPGGAARAGPAMDDGAPVLAVSRFGRAPAQQGCPALRRRAADARRCARAGHRSARRPARRALAGAGTRWWSRSSRG